LPEHKNTNFGWFCTGSKSSLRRAREERKLQQSPILLMCINSTVDDHRRIPKCNGRKRNGHGKIIPKLGIKRSSRQNFNVHWS
jgi:hypothetical protein